MENVNEINNPASEDVHLDDDQVLAYTQKIRKKGVAALMKRGEIPSDIKEQSLLYGVLSDMDRSALTNKRIKTDDAANKGMAGSAVAIAQLLQSLKVTDTINTMDLPGFKPPVIGDDVALPAVSKGEMDQGTSTTTFEDFEKQHFTGSPVNQ